MTIISWNCRGLVAATTSRELQDLMKGQKLAIFFLMETRAQQERVVRVKRKLKFNNMFCVPANGISGGLCLFWNKEFEVQILDSCNNFIHTCVKEKKYANIMEITFVYGNPLFRHRRYLWGKLLSLKPRHNVPWCCLGDFNEMLSITEKDRLRPIEPMRLNLFREFLRDVDMLDMSLKGSKYTWIITK